MASLRAVAVVALFILAGCSGIAADPPGQPTITPAPVPSPEPTPQSPADLAPGLNPDGVSDPQALVAAHGRALANHSYTTLYTVTRTRTDGTVAFRYARRAKLNADRDRICYQTRLTVDRESANASIDRHIQRWSNGTLALERIDHPDRTVFHTVTPRLPTPTRPYGGLPYDPAHQRGLINLFERVPTTVQGQITTTGTPQYRIEESESPPLLPITNLTLDVHVHESGFIEQYRITYDVVRDGELLHTIGELQYTDLGDTTVSQPPWTARALRNETHNQTALEHDVHAPWC